MMVIMMKQNRLQGLKRMISKYNTNQVNCDGYDDDSDNYDNRR